MLKNYFLLFGLILISFGLAAQITPAGVSVKDNRSMPSVNMSGASRSIQNPKSCSVDTVEYPRYKASNLVTITIAKGRGLGQLYSCPKPLDISGFTFYAFVLPSWKTAKKMEIICRLYKAGADSLPRGLPLRADTLMIDSTLGVGYLSVIEKHAAWQSITLDSNYIITVETNTDTLTAGLVTNNYANGDGDRENLNCGSISGQWYNGKNLNVGGTPFNCDILLHPHVKYSFGTDFNIKNNCYNINDSIKFINAAPFNMAGSKMYNRYMTPLYNIGYLCHIWNLGSGFSQYGVDNKTKYSIKQNYKITLISTVYGYRGDMYYGCKDTAIKTLYFKPDIPTFQGLVNVCIGDTAKFTAVSSDTGIVYEWLSKPTSGTPFYTGKTYTKYPITQNDTFYLRANNNGCVSGLRTIIIRANAYPKTLTVLNDSVCSGSKANLSASSDIGTIQWYSSATGGLPFYTGNVFQTSVLTSDTSFYVQANNNGCMLNPRTQVKALVGSSFAPSAPLISDDTTVCLGSGSIVTLQASAGSGLTVRWFDAASGGSSIGTGNTYMFMPTKREIKTFYADAYNGICGSSRVGVTITVEKAPVPVSVTGDVICKGDSAYITCVLPYGEADWYDASTSGNLSYTGETYASAPLSNTDYYLETRSGVCLSSSRTKVSITVNTFPVISKLWGDTICAKNKATLKSKLTGQGTLEWFEDDTSSVVLGTGLTFTTPVLNGSRKYSCRPVYAGCIGPRSSVQPLVKPAPFSGFSFEVMTWQQVKVSPINAAGCSVNWDFGDGFTSNNNTVTHRYASTGTYNIRLILTSLLTGCKDSTIIPVLIEESSVADINLKAGLKVFPNPATGLIYLESEQVEAGQYVEVFDVSGVLQARFILNDQLIENGIVLNDLASGLYIVRVQGYKPVMLMKQ